MKIRLPSPQDPRASGAAFLSRTLALAPVAAAGCLSAFPGSCLAQDAAQTAAPPVVRSLTKPAYPERALVLAASGDVTVEFLVDEHGRPRCIEVVEATAPQLFARPAMAAVRRWRYVPAVSGGKPVVVPVRVVVRFAYL
jgi:periplasmic protein TonB